MSMKRWKQVLGAAVIAAAVGGAGPVQAATPADTLVMARKIDDIKSLDPAEVFEWGSGEIINNLYVRLMTYDPHDFSKLVGGAVESWQVSDDGLTYELKIRKGIKFQSGRELTARDAEYSLRRVIHLAKTPVFIFQQLGWTKDNVADMVRAVDDGTLVIKVAKSYSPSLVVSCLSAGVASVIDSEEVRKHEENGDYGYNWLKTRSAGAGAYRLVTWKPKDAVVLESNPDFYLGAPPLKRFIVRHIPEPSAQRLLLQAGDVDIARDLGPDQIKASRSNPDLRVDVFKKVNTYYVGLNTKHEILANPKVWEAFRWLIDYQGMADSFLDGYFAVHQSFLTGDMGLAENPYRLDVEKAKKLLAEAGYPDGFSIDFLVANPAPFPDIAQSMQATFAQAGVKLNLVLRDQAQVLAAYRARGHELAFARWSPDYLDPHSTAEFFVRNPDNSDASTNKSAAWRNAWDIPELSAMTEQAMLERDPEVRKQIYKDEQKVVQENSPIIMMFQLVESTVSRKNTSGFTPGPGFDTAVFWNTRKTK